MKILVTGGNGQLGRSLRRISGGSGHDFSFCDLPGGDITDYDGISAVIGRSGPEVIINAAGYTAVDKAQTEREAAFRVNAQGPAVLARVAGERGIRLIHVSTDYVFPGDGNTPLREEDMTGPASVYGFSKLAGERAVEDSGCDAAIVRTSWLYSEFGHNFLKTMLRMGRERGSVSVVSDQVGTPTYAADLARALVSLAEKELSGFDLFHFSNEGVASWYDFAAEIFRAAGMNDVRLSAIATSEFPTPAPRPAYSVLDKTKIKTLGIAVPEWREALGRCMGAMANNETL